MRTFLKHKDGGMIDAADITGISVDETKGMGANVLVTTRAYPGHDGSRNTFTVANVFGPDATPGVAVDLAEDLLHAICKADEIARYKSNGAVISINESRQWVIKSLDYAIPPVTG